MFLKNKKKDQRLLLMLLILTGLFFAHCSKPIEVITKPTLFITLKNDTGKSVPGATVRLYKNAADTGITKLSDSSGVVIFYDLDTALYFWEAKKDCKTNRHSQRTLNRSLIPNVILYGYSVMSENGELIITNKSPESYKVSDSLFSVTIKSDSAFATFHKVGSYLIHSVPVSDSTKGKDILIKVICNDTLRLNLPF
ncbi:hypothetical protein BH11BAC3_BH11BAC3_28640 [soil metagenome]